MLGLINGLAAVLVLGVVPGRKGTWFAYAPINEDFVPPEPPLPWEYVAIPAVRWFDQPAPRGERSSP